MLFVEFILLESHHLKTIKKKRICQIIIRWIWKVKTLHTKQAIYTLGFFFLFFSSLLLSLNFPSLLQSPSPIWKPCSKPSNTWFEVADHNSGISLNFSFRTLIYFTHGRLSFRLWSTSWLPGPNSVGGIPFCSESWMLDEVVAFQFILLGNLMLLVTNLMRCFQGSDALALLFNGIYLLTVFVTFHDLSVNFFSGLH